jgi:hypothetical protein
MESGNSPYHDTSQLCPSSLWAPALPSAAEARTEHIWPSHPSGSGSAPVIEHRRAHSLIPSPGGIRSTIWSFMCKSSQSNCTPPPPSNRHGYQQRGILQPSRANVPSWEPGNISCVCKPDQPRCTRQAEAVTGRGNRGDGEVDCRTFVRPGANDDMDLWNSIETLT